MSSFTDDPIAAASSALQQEDYERVLSLVEEALGAGDARADLLILRGIALAQTGRPEEATLAFREAIRLEPTNAKAFYNLAVHLFHRQERVEALAMAREALRLDPRHESARELVARIEEELRPRPPERPDPYPPLGEEFPVGSFPYPPSAPLEPVHTLSWIERMGAGWTVLGLILAAMNLVALGLGAYIFLEVFAPLLVPDSNFDPGNVEEVTKRLETWQRDNLGLTLLSNVLGTGSLLGILVWAILDIVDRRSNWLWLFLVLPCTCCSLGWLALPFYMLVGRPSAPRRPTYFR